MKLLGPIRDFVLSAKTNKRWMEKDLPLITTTGDNTNFRVIFLLIQKTIDPLN